VIACTVLGVFTVWENRKMIRWRKRRYPMEKIVILSDNSGGSYRWITLFNALFPECEIEIRMVSPDEEGLQSSPLGSFAKDSITDELTR
jgi:hypothetical protein